MYICNIYIIYILNIYLITNIYKMVFHICHIHLHIAMYDIYIYKT